MCRMTQMQYGRGFYTWLENTREYNQKKRTMKKVMIYWKKNWLLKAFRTWAKQHYNSIQGELNTNHHDTLANRRALQKHGDETAIAQANEI